MLYADKRALETNLKVNLLAIREKELNYYTQNCLAINTQAALLAGFAYSGLTQVAIPLDSEYVLKLLYLLVTSTAMCLELIAVMSTTLLSMMGPGLALRGPDGSMHPAVDGMMEEYRSAYLNFLLGLIAFHVSAALFGWLTFSCAPPPPSRPLLFFRRTNTPFAIRARSQGSSRCSPRCACSRRSTCSSGTRCACTRASACPRRR